MIEREVQLVAGDTTLVLSPTLQALRAIAQRWPKMEEAYNDLRGLNFDACSVIVGAGAGLKSQQAQEAVFAAGLVAATAASFDLLALLINPEGESAEDAKPGK